MSPIKIKVPAFETIYNKLDDYVAVDEAKSKGQSKNDMNPVTIYNAFINELKDIKIANGTFNHQECTTKELTMRGEAQHRQVNFKGDNKDFLKDVYSSYLKEDIALRNEQIKEAMNPQKTAPRTKSMTKSKGLSL